MIERAAGQEGGGRKGRRAGGRAGEGRRGRRGRRAGGVESGNGRRGSRGRKAAPDGDEFCAFEDRGPDCRERPGVAEIPQQCVLRETDVIPVVDEPVVELEHEPERDRCEREEGELAGSGSDPRSAARAPDGRVGEDDEAGPGDRRVPGGKRLDACQGGGLGEDHHGEPEQRPPVHVTRIRYEQPRSAGVPTPLPSSRTFNVLPRPPGIRRVFRARRSLRSARFSGPGFTGSAANLENL